MSNHNQICIFGMLIRDRIKEAGKTQQLLTKYADIIKTRLGFHELSMDKCSRQGIILIQLHGNTEKWAQFETELMNIGGIQVNKMTFNK